MFDTFSTTPVDNTELLDEMGSRDLIDLTDDVGSTDSVGCINFHCEFDIKSFPKSFPKSISKSIPKSIPKSISKSISKVLRPPPGFECYINNPTCQDGTNEIKNRLDFLEILDITNIQNLKNLIVLMTQMTQ